MMMALLQRLVTVNCVSSLKDFENDDDEEVVCGPKCI